MKKMTVISIFLSMFFSVAALAEEHAEAALEHTQMAVQEGKAGRPQALVKHANEALPHAIKAAEVAQGEAKTHLQEGIKSLKSAIEHGNLQGQENGETATKAAEEAAEHLKAGNL
jgi:hypothetical protein